MGATSVQIEGVDRLLGRLGEVEAKGVRKVMLKAIVEGAKIVRAAIRAEAPVAKKDTTGKYAHARGALKAGVRYKASRKRTGQLAYMVGPFGKGTAERHLVISGHAIRGRARLKLGKTIVARHRVARSGERTTANPFVERGKAQSQAAAFAALEAAAKARFEEVGRG